MVLKISGEGETFSLNDAEKGFSIWGGELILDSSLIPYMKVHILTEDLTVEIKVYNFGGHTH